MIGFGFGAFGAVFSMVFGLIFIGFVFLFIYLLVRNIKQWNKDQHSPRLTVNASAVTKRTSVTTHHHHTGNDMMHMTHSTWYYVTFEVESGDRMELAVSAGEYGMIAEGDCGKLTFQGSRFISFDRLA